MTNDQIRQQMAEIRGRGCIRVQWTAPGTYQITGIGPRMVTTEDVNWLLEQLERALARGRGCPCHWTEPCSPECTCVNGLYSAGCRRCCRYGSDEYRRKKAEHIAEKLKT